MKKLLVRALFCSNIMMMLGFTCVNPIYAQENDNTDTVLTVPNEIISDDNDRYILADDIINADNAENGAMVEERITLYDEDKGIVTDSFQLQDAFNKVSARVAKPAGYSSCFKKVEWIKRSNVWSLSITPKYAANGYSKEQSWNILKKAHVNDSHWKNKNVNSMYHQYTCHYDLAGPFKTPWNIEPSKKDKGYWGFAANLCN